MNINFALLGTTIEFREYIPREYILGRVGPLAQKSVEIPSTTPVFIFEVKHRQFCLPFSNNVLIHPGGTVNFRTNFLQFYIQTDPVAQKSLGNPFWQNPLLNLF